MTPAEADQRIIMSRQALHRYVDMVEGGVIPHSDLGIVMDEISILEGIASEHPGKAAELENLIKCWVKLSGMIKAKLN